MSTTAKVCRVDDEDRVVFDEDEDQDLGLDEDGFLELDASWGALQTLLASLTAIDLFTSEALTEAEAASLARVLAPLPWKKAVEAGEAPDDDDDVAYVKPYYKALRALVLRAAKEGSGLRCEYT